MLRTRTAAVAIAAFSVRVVLAVPAFAQSSNLSLSSTPFVPLEADRTRTGVARAFYTEDASASWPVSAVQSRRAAGLS